MSKIKSFKSFLESNKDKFPNFKKFDISGFTVIVGKDAKSNDYITFQMASDDDIWMHVKGHPGSHVVIKLTEHSNTKETNLPTTEVLREAASLAKKNSKANKEPKVTIVWCKRKYVKKDSGMNDGQVRVDYKNSHEIQI